MDEEQLRDIDDRLKYLRNLEARKEEVLNSIEEQGKLTPELAAAIQAATKLQEVEDLYRPYKQKKRTRAMIAKERGLEPLADLIWNQQVESGVIGIGGAFYQCGSGGRGYCSALAGPWISSLKKWRMIRVIGGFTGIFLGPAVIAS